MRVTVINNHLNIRVGKPRLNAPTYQYLAPGSEIEVDGEIYKGDLYNDIDTWLRDAGDNYYWSGGVKQKTFDKSVVEGTFNDRWFQTLGISKVWNQFKEKGDRASALILDTGINTDVKQISSAIRGEIKNFVLDSTVTDNEDAECHGTHCASLIAASDQLRHIGVAPESKLLVGKISRNGSFDLKTLKLALTEYLNDEHTFDIISLSLALSSPDDELESLIKKHADKNHIIIASVGNDPLNENREFSRYPSAYTNCISVGSCSDAITLSKFSMCQSKTNIFCFGESIFSYKKSSNPEALTGTSQSTAIVAGICCLIISWLKNRQFIYNTQSIKTLLTKYSTGLVNRPQLRLIQPVLIFTKLENFNNHEERNLQNCIDADVIA